MKQKLLLLLLLIVFGAANAQIQVESRPYSFLNSNMAQLDLRSQKVLSPAKSIAEALKEDEVDEEIGVPPRFGLKVETNLNPNNSGMWVDLPNGARIWRLPIKSPEALSISLLYEKYHLPPGGTMHIYDSEKNQVIGAFTELNNKGTLKNPGKFATGLVYGDAVILEYYHPEKAAFEPIISIGGIVHGYKYIKLNEKDIDEDGIGPFGGSGECQVNINCEEGNDWQDEKRGVALLLVADCTRLCSGSLVNTSSNDGTPYLLTADHCLDVDGFDAAGDTDASQWIFYWNYEAPNCANPVATPAITTTAGATLLANRADTDFALFELTESPIEAGFNVYFNGWSRTTSPGQDGVGIHHPAGDIKKIATHNMVPVNGQVYGSDHWRVNWIATANGHSVTEGGSSGSPLFRNNGQIIGQLHGGSNVNCTDPAADPGEYGKFHLSWDGSSNIRRLRSWLGPSGSNFSANGRYFCDNLAISGAFQFCPSASYSVNVPDDYPVTWSVSPANALTFTQGSSTTTFTRNGGFNGSVTITANIAAPCGPITVTKNVLVQPTIGVNITNAQHGSTMTISATATGGTAVAFPKIRTV